MSAKLTLHYLIKITKTVENFNGFSLLSKTRTHVRIETNRHTPGMRLICHQE